MAASSSGGTGSSGLGWSPRGWSLHASQARACAAWRRTTRDRVVTQRGGHGVVVAVVAPVVEDVECQPPDAGVGVLEDGAGQEVERRLLASPTTARELVATDEPVGPDRLAHLLALARRQHAPTVPRAAGRGQRVRAPPRRREPAGYWDWVGSGGAGVAWSSRWTWSHVSTSRSVGDMPNRSASSCRLAQVKKMAAMIAHR